jgi:hypothetical protein
MGNVDKLNGDRDRNKDLKDLAEGLNAQELRGEALDEQLMIVRECQDAIAASTLEAIKALGPFVRLSKEIIPFLESVANGPGGPGAPVDQLPADTLRDYADEAKRLLEIYYGGDSDE